MKINPISFILIVLGVLPLLACAHVPPAPRPLTVADSIESTRLLRATDSPVTLSPDGQRYVAFFESGDLRHNGTWVQLVSGSTGSLDAAQGVVAAKLFSSSKAVINDLAKKVRWLPDNESVAFIWDDGQKPKLISVNLRTHEQKALLEHPTSMVDYDMSLDGQTIVYSARLENDASVSEKMRRDGFAIQNQNTIDLLAGHLDAWRPNQHAGLYVTTSKQPQPRRIALEMENVMLASVSPDGQYALVSADAGVLPRAWERYTDGWFGKRLRERREDSASEAVSQLYVIDLVQSSTRPLWNAPAASGRQVWLPDSRHIILGPTFLPVEQADALGLGGLAAAEVDVTNGSFTLIPIPPDAPLIATGWIRGYRPLRWRDGMVVEFGDAYGTADDVKLHFKRTDGHWAIVSGQAELGKAAAVRVELRQDPNTPPALFAVESKSGRERKIWDSNPALRKDFSLGRVGEIHWKNIKGESMTGILYYPVHLAPGKKFPLVLYPHGVRRGIFSLDGLFTTVYAAQALANRDIAVLLLRWSDNQGSELLGTAAEPETIMANCESAVEYLAGQGWVDRDRVGLTGFSRPGWYVEYMLTHSKLPFAAAIAADNSSTNYTEYALSLPFRGDYEGDVGAIPFGEGLKTWLQVSPAFNADKIHTPLRLEEDSGPVWSVVLNQWELFAQLRRHKRPVELYIVPDSEHGGHPLQNPQQRLASQGGAVDWFDFWLNGHEDPDPVKAEQYQRWHELRRLQIAQDAEQASAGKDSSKVH
jgi:dipeptidyl aminopeptidase/acylaminoacyl peptidase